MTVEEFCSMIDVNKPNFFAEMQKIGRVNQSATTLEELTTQEKDLLDKLENEYRRKMYLSSESV